MSHDILFREKRKFAKAVKDCYQFQNPARPTLLVVLKDEKLINSLLDGLQILSCDFVVCTEKKFKKYTNIATDSTVKHDLLKGFDGIITDNDTENLITFFKSGVVPILPENNHLAGILKEFDPLESEGNSFFYKKDNVWSLYLGIVRYLENYKFPYDHKNLVKNIASI